MQDEGGRAQMCGRMALTLPDAAMTQLFEAAPDTDLPQRPDYNICPTVPVHVVTSDAGVRRLRSMRWGFLPHWYKTMNGGPLLINARSETIAEKPAFREACRARRCLIPASGFYEWNREGEVKLPWYVTRADGAPLVFAGVWQAWGVGAEAVVSCAIVTCAANAAFARVHHRLPVVLEPADWAKWLGEEGKGAARLMRTAEDHVLSIHRVSPAVNSNRASGPALIQALAPGSD